MEKHRPAKILIVDDEEHNRKLLEVFAKADGYLTVSADNGDAALVSAVTDQPDIILLDLMMPDMDGFEIARWLKANAATQSIPIIFVTALDDAASQKRMRASGADEFINKPVNRWELSQCIAKLLEARRDASKSGNPSSAKGEKKSE